MSRFINLEFGDESEDSSSAAQVKDEAFYCQQAQQAFERGAYEPALRSYSKALEFNPQNVSAWAGQVRMLIELHEYREARLWAEKALERFPTAPELLASKAVALGRMGELDEALAFSDAAIEERGDTPYIWLARGDVLLARQESRADYCFDKAALLAPQDWFVLWLAGRIRLFYEHFAAAARLFQRAVELNCGNFLVWLELGHCQRAMGISSQARLSYARALEIEPSCTDARISLAQMNDLGLVRWIKALPKRFLKK